MAEEGVTTVYTGPMMTGKTTALIDALQPYDRVMAFKPATDDRYDTERIVTHDGAAVPAHVVEPTPDGVTALLETVRKTDPDAVGIDEAQFFDDRLVDAVAALTADGYDVVVAGLDKDFRGEPFGPMPALLDAAEEKTVLMADCAVCGEAAAYTQRLLDGAPAPFDAPVVDIGGSEKYEPRCRSHHAVPR